MKSTLTLLTALLLAPPVVLAQTKTTPQSNTVADKTPAAVDELDQALTLARRTLDFVQRSRPGPGLVVLDNWKDGPRETPLLAGQLPAGTVMHPDLSFDARRVAFAFCDHTPADPNLRQFFL